MRQFMMKILFNQEWITFIWMGVFFVAFGVSSLNLFMLFKANFNLYLEHGAMVIGEGALRQLIELIVSGYLSLLFYLLFKACERVLVERMTQGGRSDQRASRRRQVAPAPCWRRAREPARRGRVS